MTVGWFELATVGPWGALVIVVGAVLIAFLREGLVSGTTARKNDERSKAEIERLTQLYRERIAESRQREDEWRKIAELHDQRADVAAGQVETLLAALREAGWRPASAGGGNGGVRADDEVRSA